MRRHVISSGLCCRLLASGFDTTSRAVPTSRNVLVFVGFGALCWRKFMASGNRVYKMLGHCVGSDARVLPGPSGPWVGFDGVCNVKLAAVGQRLHELHGCSAVI